MELKAKDLAIAVAFGTACWSGIEAEAAIVRYDFETRFNIDETVTTEFGTASGFFEYELGAVSSFGNFTPTAFSLVMSAPSLDTLSFSSDDLTSQGVIAQGSFSGFVFGVFGQLPGGYDDLELHSVFRIHFGSLAPSYDVLGLVDTENFISGRRQMMAGFGYCTLLCSGPIDSATLTLASVPLPTSGALLALVAGGAGLRSAAKSRRAAKRVSQTG